MIEFLQRIQEHAAELSAKLSDQGAGGELISAAMTLGRTVYAFCAVAYRATRDGESIQPAIDRLLEEAPPVLFEVSNAMPSLADVLFDPETWETSILEIGDSEMWNQTMKVGSAVIDRFVGDCIDILMNGPDARQFDVVENLSRVEKSLSEIIDVYLLPLVE